MKRFEELITKEIGKNNVLLGDLHNIIYRVNKKMEKKDNFFRLVMGKDNQLIESVAIHLSQIVIENEEELVERFADLKMLGMKIGGGESIMMSFKNDLLKDSGNLVDQEREFCILNNLVNGVYKEDIFYGKILKMNIQLVEDFIEKNEIMEAKPHIADFKKVVIEEIENKLSNRLDNLLDEYEKTKIEITDVRKELVLIEKRREREISGEIVSLSKKKDDGSLFITSADVLGKIMGKKINEVKEEESINFLYERISELELQGVIILEKTKLVMLDSVSEFALENFTDSYYDGLWGRFNKFYEIEKKVNNKNYENGVNLLLKAFLIGVVEKKYIESKNTDKLLEMMSADIKKDILNENSWLQQTKEKSLNILLDFGVSKLSSVIEILGANFTTSTLFTEKRLNMK